MELWEALVTGLVLFMVVSHLHQNWVINTHNKNRRKRALYGRMYVTTVGLYTRFFTRIALVLVIIYWVWKWSN